MNPADNETINELREAFAHFWDGQLKVETSPQGLIVALPLMYADGWQVIVHLERATPSHWLLSDHGVTLGKLIEGGLKTERAKTREVVAAQAKFYGFEQDGLQLQKVIAYPFQVHELQIFAEALVALSHLAASTAHFRGQEGDER